MSKVRICDNCETDLAENSKFCASCGTKYVEPKIKSTPKPKPSQSVDRSSSAANDNIKLIAGIVVGLLIGGIAGLALIDDGSTTISSLELGIGALESEKKQLMSRNMQVGLDINNISAELERVKEFEGKASELELSLQTANNEKSELNTQLSQINDEKDSLETQVLDLDGQITELNAEIQELNDEVAEGNQEIQDLNVEVLKASQANTMIASLESQISELNRLKNSLQTQINDSNARILSLENSIADKDALIASLNNDVLFWQNRNLNSLVEEIASQNNLNIPEGLCWTVDLYNHADPDTYIYMLNYNGYFILEYSSSVILDVWVYDDDGYWTNSPAKSSDVLYIPHTPDAILTSNAVGDWVLQICSLDADATVTFNLSFKF